MTDSAKRRAPILAAGGIVLRGDSRPRIAIVRMRRDKAWVLPKGKLNPREHPRDAAVREVLEETGYHVSVHDFLGSVAYPADGKVKIVQFWLMRAAGRPSGNLTDDVKAVKWLPLKRAIATLSRPHEKVFLTHVGRPALRAFKKLTGRKSRTAARIPAGRQDAGAPNIPIGHVIAIDNKVRPKVFARALGDWMGRAPRGAVREAG
jgi:8-oxo-dGTP diphosphatase